MFLSYIFSLYFLLEASVCKGGLFTFLSVKETKACKLPKESLELEDDLEEVILFRQEIAVPKTYDMLNCNIITSIMLEYIKKMLECLYALCLRRC